MRRRVCPYAWISPILAGALGGSLGVGSFGAVGCAGDDSGEVTSEGGTSTSEAGETTAASTTGDSGTGGDSTSTGGGDGTDELSTGSSGEPVCPQGQLICEGDEAKICDGAGGFESSELCTALCFEPLGCVACEPGARECHDGDAYVCAEDGLGLELVQPCDPVQGLSCDEGRGVCVGACALESLDDSNVGCEFYAVTTAALQTGQPWIFNFALAVLNTSDQDASFKVEQGMQLLDEQVIPAGAAVIVELPYEAALSNAAYDVAEPSVMAPEGAFHVRSDQPVVVFQYNPLGYKIGPSFAYSGDGSVLAPTHTWGLEHRVVSRAHWTDGDYGYSGSYALTARYDGTVVTLEPSATGGVVLAGGGVAADGTGRVTLDAGDVLQVVTDSAGGEPDASDLTGTRVLASKPVQLIGGHKCTNVPFDMAACDHLEEVIPPLSALGREHVVAAPLIPSGGPVPKDQMVRITAAEDNTSLEYEPAQPGAPVELAFAGEYVELGPLNDDFVITSSAPVVVTQYMLGQTAGGNVGDPALLSRAPVEQFRSEYQLHAAPEYDISYVTVVAPVGAEVTLDGAQLQPFEAIGESGFAVARTPLQMTPDGQHYVSSDSPFGVDVYGYGQFATYWFSGGQRRAAL